MATNSFIVTTIHRAPSSGSENKFMKTFASLADASAWIQHYLLGLCQDYNWPEDWDAADMGGAPAPTADLVAQIASADALRSLLAANKRGREVLVWGPQSEYEMQRPEEILLVETW